MVLRQVYAFAKICCRAAHRGRQHWPAPVYAEASPGHVITCHIPMAELREVEPVIVQVEKDQSAAE